MIKVVIFDFDGVIFDTIDIAYDIVKETCDKHCKVKINSMKDFLKLYKTNFYEAMKKMGVDDMGAIKKEQIDRLRKVKPKPFKGIKNVLKKLKQTHKTAVVSSNFQDIMEMDLKRENMMGLFDIIIGADKIESKIKKIKFILKKFNLDESEALFVTDTSGDLKEAKEAGISTMGVAWGFLPKEELLKESPDYIAERPEDIIREMA
jgi:phosphoglycolate phosphatase-like HAD superfamily hydrolase